MASVYLVAQSEWLLAAVVIWEPAAKLLQMLGEGAIWREGRNTPETINKQAKA